jgi:hypothetical protein
MDIPSHVLCPNPGVNHLVHLAPGHGLGPGHVVDVIVVGIHIDVRGGHQVDHHVVPGVDPQGEKGEEGIAGIDAHIIGIVRIQEVERRRRILGV